MGTAQTPPAPIVALCGGVGAARFLRGLARVVDFSDLLLLAMAFPNLIGVVLLSKHIDADLSSYLRRLRAGEFDRS